jgi:hypothetical protein
MNKHIIYQSDYELLAFYVKGKTLSAAQSFQINEKDEAKFARYLSQDVKTPIHWLIDTPQEEYQRELLPHVWGKDRLELINHKKRRLFENSIYNYAVIQGRESQGRRDDVALFIALNNPNLFQPWLNLVITFKIPLAGIYSLPLLSENLLKYLPKAPYTLLVAHTPPMGTHSPAGLRQSFFFQQQLQLSRLVPLDIHNPQQYTDYVLRQISTTYRYLENTRRLAQLEQPSALSVVILTDINFFKSLKQRVKESLPNITVHVLESNQFTQQLGLQIEATTLYLYHWVAYALTRPWYNTNHYAKPKETRYFFYRQLRLGIYLAALLLLVSASIASWMLLEQAMAVKQQGQTIEAKISNRQADLDKLKSKVPPLPLDNIVLIRNVVDVGSYIKAHHVSPQAAWEQLSHSLSRHPNLILEHLEWGIGEVKADIFPSHSPSILADDMELENSVEFQDSTTAYFWEGMRIHGKIDGFQGNYHQAAIMFRKFIEDLQQTDSWQVEEQRAPYDPNQALQGRIDSRSDIDEVTFIIDIFIQHSYAKTTF